MNFDQMLETWRTQNTAPSFDVDRDALRQALQAEEARVLQEMRTYRRSLWIAWVIGTGMAIFAGFWIAICISNGWSVIYVVASAVSFGMFALGAGAIWRSRGRRVKSEEKFSNTVQEEVRHNLMLVEHQLSVTRHLLITTLGAAFIFFGALLFNWTINRSQNIPDSLSYRWWITALLIVFAVRTYRKTRDEMSETKPKLELRQRRLRDLLASLDDECK